MSFSTSPVNFWGFFPPPPPSLCPAAGAPPPRPPPPRAAPPPPPAAPRGPLVRGGVDRVRPPAQLPLRPRGPGAEWEARPGRGGGQRPWDRSQPAERFAHRLQLGRPGPVCPQRDRGPHFPHHHHPRAPHLPLGREPHARAPGAPGVPGSPLTAGRAP